MRTNQGVVRHVDARGNLRWERVVGAPFSIGAGVAALPDGSYVTVVNDPSRRPGQQSRWTFDLKLNRFAPTGQRLDSTWIGRPGDYDFAYQVKPTTDGGLVIVGTNDENLPNSPERSLLVKLDSAWREQWRITETAPGTNSGSLSDWHLVHEVAAGQFIVGGGFSTAGGLGLVLPPATPTDTVGSLAWATFLNFRRTTAVGLFFEPGTVGYVVGRNCGGFPSNAYFTGCVGLPAPVAVDLCATPPPPPRPTFSPPAGSTITFGLDSLATQAGARYAVIDEVDWEFGDGSPPATGWQVRHAYASPQPVTVRVCVTNNLFCRTCTDLYPLGTSAQVGAANRVRVYPNPSAEGHFTVAELSSGAHLTVFDAVGRRVAQQTATTTETRLDLHLAPPGFYLLRISSPNGQTTTHKLVRGQ